MKKLICEFFDWLLINLVIPVILPYLFLLMAKLVIKTDMDYQDTFYKLLDNGVYTFVGLLLLLSLFQDYRHAKKVFNPLFYIFCCVSCIIIGLIFMSSIGVVTGESARTFKENTPMFVIVTSLNIVVSSFFKVQMLRTKYGFNN